MRVWEVFSLIFLHATTKDSVTSFSLIPHLRFETHAIRLQDTPLSPSCYLWTLIEDFSTWLLVTLCIIALVMIPGDLIFMWVTLPTPWPLSPWLPFLQWSCPPLCLSQTHSQTLAVSSVTGHFHHLKLQASHSLTTSPVLLFISQLQQLFQLTRTIGPTTFQLTLTSLINWLFSSLKCMVCNYQSLFCKPSKISCPSFYCTCLAKLQTLLNPNSSHSTLHWGGGIYANWSH